MQKKNTRGKKETTKRFGFSCSEIHNTQHNNFEHECGITVKVPNAKKLDSFAISSMEQHRSSKKKFKFEFKSDRLTCVCVCESVWILVLSHTFMGSSLVLWTAHTTAWNDVCMFAARIERQTFVMEMVMFVMQTVYLMDGFELG